MPVLTNRTSRFHRVAGQGPVVNGAVIDIRKTHPNLWLLVMTYGGVCTLLGLNFLFLSPTFLLWQTPNYVWGVVFMFLACAKFVFLNVYRNLRLVRLTMAAEVGFMLFIALGATEPFLTGKGSLQLPILYVGMALLELPLLLEPFINPWTARRD
jgi:hypothetical protein